MNEKSKIAEEAIGVLMEKTEEEQPVPSSPSSSRLGIGGRKITGNNTPIAKGAGGTTEGRPLPPTPSQFGDNFEKSKKEVQDKEKQSEQIQQIIRVRNQLQNFLFFYSFLLHPKFHF
jgi:hypothetical protein